MMVTRMIWMIRTTKKTFRMKGNDDGVDEKTATSELQTGTGRSQKGCRPSVRENDHQQRSDDPVNLADDQNEEDDDHDHGKESTLTTTPSAKICPIWSVFL